jgi:hypothetical protein
MSKFITITAYGCHLTAGIPTFKPKEDIIINADQINCIQAFQYPNVKNNNYLIIGFSGAGLNSDHTGMYFKREDIEKALGISYPPYI